MATRSPRATPSSFRAFAHWQTSSRSCCVGDLSPVARLALPVVGDLVAAPGFNMAVEAVIGDVELTAVEPLGERRVPFQDGVPLPIPAQRFRLLGPECLEVGIGALVQRAILEWLTGRRIQGRAERFAAPTIMLRSPARRDVGLSSGLLYQVGYVWGGRVESGQSNPVVATTTGQLAVYKRKPPAGLRQFPLRPGSRSAAG